MAKPRKEIKGKIKLIIIGGQANPAPPLGPILGQNGIPLQDFCSQFNEKSRDQMGEELPVAVTIYKDNSFEMKIFRPTVSGMLKKASGIQKGSGTANKDKVGKVTNKQVEEIAEKKMPDLNTRNLEAAKRVVAGTAKSMGIEVV